MRMLVQLALLLILIAALAVGFNNYNNSPVQGKADVYATNNNVTPPARAKAAELIFYEDYTYKITPIMPGISKKLETAISAALKKDELPLNCEQQQGELTMMYCRKVCRNDKDYCGALLNEIAGQLNKMDKGIFYSVEAR